MGSGDLAVTCLVSTDYRTSAYSAATMWWKEPVPSDTEDFVASLRADSLLSEADGVLKSNGSQIVQVGEPYFPFLIRDGLVFLTLLRGGQNVIRAYGE
jgi:hypothetical protein